ncbi:hypothetical protein K6U56_12315 [Vibrio furnissii]|uniref:hypothetical protein n=1 Tax=Vibrio furnissii TaxID=29494 RepID=UPI00130218BB|nr:hypothetical protein [Vibrio furnissii]MCG6212748.1 hypothetical protein [Vibrio furnissii]
MSDRYSKPQNVSDMGVSFEERLAQLGKLSKQSREGNGFPSATNSGLVNSNANSERGLASNKNVESAPMINPKSQKALDHYKEKGQSKQILKVWFMLMQAFDSKMKMFFGDEPDVHFMKFAVSLTPESYKRLEANLLERLDEDREWPPSLIRLRQLANSPTKETMYNARQRLIHHPVPVVELDRVEKFIKKYKMTEVKSFSERNFETEFNRKYTQWFREVLLEDMDLRLEEKRKEISHYLEQELQTEHDIRREELISNGKAFDNKFGQRIKKMCQEKNVQAEEVPESEARVIEQERLAEQIRKKTSDA